MLPITDFLSCTEPIDEFESLSSEQQHHAKTYTTGLVAASNKTVAGIAREILPAQGKRAVNKLVASQSPLDFASGSLDCEVTAHGCFG
jgi:hypothetical protein